ncbi:DUF2442 domain-containing protein [Desulfonatronovibrio magnus]|uniref:DUF2442 domain-containing protein n=1 Tax=Desulfonatronovibrio magnus TaxID=698827 RepID=UPI0005EB59EA|nr:DUF2442 domain-containing protein [Desulfonatronovibrio magnus]
MNPRVKDVRPNDDYTLNLLFDNGEERVFNVSPYLDKGIFKELRDINMFKSVKPVLGSIQWKHGQDFCPDTLYLASKRATHKD